MTLPGAEMISAPKAEPPITTSSLGWIKTANGPSAMAKPPSTEPITTMRPMMVDMTSMQSAPWGRS
jgi:hypothetical protein